MVLTEFRQLLAHINRTGRPCGRPSSLYDNGIVGMVTRKGSRVGHMCAAEQRPKIGRITLVLFFFGPIRREAEDGQKVIAAKDRSFVVAVATLIASDRGGERYGEINEISHET